MLVDREIADAIRTGEIQLKPRDGAESRIQPASLDVRLAHRFASFVRTRQTAIDPKNDSSADWRHDEIKPGEAYVIHPGDFVLAATLEKVGLPTNIVARVEGKSSLGRLGLLVHATAGFIDPGWPLASITLELSNVNSVPIRLYPGMPIGQLCFTRTQYDAQAYVGKYVGQDAPIVSRFHENWTGSAWI